MIDPREIENRFSHHVVTDRKKREDIFAVRQHCKKAADKLNELLPDGREKAIVMTKLEEAMFWANAGLARQNTIRSEIA